MRGTWPDSAGRGHQPAPRTSLARCLRNELAAMAGCFVASPARPWLSDVVRAWAAMGTAPQPGQGHCRQAGDSRLHSPVTSWRPGLPLSVLPLVRGWAALERVDNPLRLPDGIWTEGPTMAWLAKCCAARRGGRQPIEHASRAAAEWSAALDRVSLGQSQDCGYGLWTLCFVA